MSRFDSIWYQNHPLSVLLAPLGWLYCAGVLLRRGIYRLGIAFVGRLDVPVIVVGNISVGGTGKTPLVIWVANHLKARGYRPGIVSRGYGGRAVHWPQQVRPDSDPVVVGDEPLLIARGTRCPVAADPDRFRAAGMLVAHAGCDVIISDDGLQHMALGRDVEIVVIDGVRRHGNGRCLPAGPLREPESRISAVDLVVANGGALPGEYDMRLVPEAARPVRGRAPSRPLGEFAGGSVHAVCGIGHPARFFDMLRGHGLALLTHAFPDHHGYRAEDIAFDDGFPVLMTEKDAVKCRRFAAPEHWYVPVRAELAPQFGRQLLALLP